MIARPLLLIAAIAAATAQTPLAPPPPAAKPPARPAASGKPSDFPRSGAAPSYKDLKHVPLRPPAAPQFARFDLPNGMKLLLLEDHERPMVTGAALVRTGSVFDPPDRVGLAALTGTLIRSGGSGARTPEQFDLELERLGASMDSSIGENLGTVSFSTLKENTEAALSLFRDLLTAPAFRRDRLDAAKVSLMSAIARRNDDTKEVLRRELWAALYGKDSLRSRRPEHATVRRILRADVDSFYRRYFVPANTVLAISGDFDTPVMKAAVESAFSEWKTPGQAVTELPKSAGGGSPGAYLAWMREAKETVFALGVQGPDVREDDAAPLDVLASILGAMPKHRLIAALATPRSGIREVRAECIPGQGRAGAFVVSGSVESPSTAEIVKSVFDEIQKLRATEVADEELRAAKDATLLRRSSGLDNKERALAVAATFEISGYPAGFLDQFAARIAAVTRADLLRVAKERLAPEKFVVTVVSNLTVFSRPLDPRGADATRIDLTIPEAKPEPSQPETGSIEDGKRLLRRAQQAAGSAEKLASVKDMSATTDYKMLDGAEDHELDRWIAPSSLRQDGRSTRAGTLIRYTDGANGWMSNGRNSSPMPATLLKMIRGDLLRLFIPMLLSDRVAGRTIHALDDQTVEIGEGDLIARVVFDSATGLPAKLMYELAGDQGLPALVQEDLSDYRDVGGIKLPFAIAILQNGAHYADGVVSGYKLNEGLKVEVLQRRP